MIAEGQSRKLCIEQKSVIKSSNEYSYNTEKQARKADITDFTQTELGIETHLIITK